MTVEKIISTFENKGYVLLKMPNYELDSHDTNTLRHVNIENVKKALHAKYKLDEKTIDYLDGISTNYLILFDKERVSINIVSMLSDFVDIIANQKSCCKDTDYIYYRGHTDTRYILEPSLYRESNRNILKSEDKLYRDILSSKPHFFDECNTTLEKLVKMQHHGIPTRLLDLTENPLIALYFACNGNMNANGEVLVFNIASDKFKYFDSDTVSVVTNLSKCSFEFDITDCKLPNQTAGENGITSTDDGDNTHNESSSNKVYEFNQNKKISELVHFIREDKPYFLNKINPKHLMNYSVVVKPKMSIERIVNQSGAFVLFGINRKKALMSDFNVTKKNYKQKVIIIPSEYKHRILKELKMFNINNSTVFGDLDTTAKYFTDKYR